MENNSCSSCIVSFIIGFYILILLILILPGIGGANSGPNWGCSVKQKWEYIFPTYRLGCYLGKDIEEKQ